MKTKIWIKIVSALGVLLVAVIVAGIAILKSIDFNDFKSDIKSLVAQSTGRDVTLGGDINLVVSLNPTLQISDVTLGNADWGEAKPMMLLKSLNAKVDLMSLLSGQVNVDYFAVDGLTLFFQTDGKGLANWEFTPATTAQQVSPETSPSGALTFVPSIRDVRLNNVDLTYLDGATGGKVHVALANVNVQADTFDSPMHAVIAAAINGVDFDVKADLGSMHHFVGSQGGAFPVDLTATARGITLNVKGGVEQPQQGMKVHAKISAILDDMAVASKLTGQDLSNLGQAKAHLNVLGSGTTYEFSDVNIKSKNSDLTGRFKLDLSSAVPRLKGNFSSSGLNINRLLGIKTGLHPATTVGPYFTADKLPLTGLKQADVDVSFKAKSILVQSFNLKNVDVGIVLKRGALNVKPVKIQMLEGMIVGQAKVDAGKKVPRLSANLKLSGVDVGKFVEAFGYGNLAHLRMDGRLKLSARGPSTQALASSATGSINLFGQNGTINDQMIKSVGSGLGNILPWASQADANIISCFVVQLPIKNGNAVAKTVQMETPGFDVLVSGNIDLAGERLHLTVNPHAKTTSLASFAVPLRIKGSFAQPYVSVNPEDAVLSTVSNIVKAPVGVLIDIFGVGKGSKKSNSLNNTCFDTAKPSHKKRANKTKSMAVPPPQNNTGPSANPIKDLGSALQGIFGK